MLFDEQDLIDRALRREKYLEDTNFRCWSDITPRQNLEEESDYRDKKDYYMLKYYLAGGYANNHDMEQLILMNLDNPEINWKGLYDYFDERLREAPKWLQQGVQDSLDALEPYRSAAYPTPAFVGY